MLKRLVVVFCACLFLFCGLFVRIGVLATDQSLFETANAQSSYTISFNTTRGQIYDCKLIPMVNNDKSYVASCMPTPENMVGLLNAEYFTSKEDMNKLIEKGMPFLVKSSIANTNLDNVNIFTIPKRYSDNQLAPHIIGYLDSDNQNGVIGVEKAFNDFLKEKSTKSTITYKVDGLRKPLAGEKPKVSYAPIIQNGVVLTIDSRIQKICEEAGNKYLNKGAIVVMEPSTGKIRATASFPSFNPKYLSYALEDTKNAPLLNRAFNPYTVGSTFKIATSATALSQGISPYFSYKCTGEIDIFGQKFNCHEENGHGLLSMKSALQVSCNPYFINLSQSLDKKMLYNMAKDLSFSKASVFAEGLYSKAGYLPNLNELNNPADIANLSFGQGLLMATPVQIAQMMCSVVNGGNTPSAQLIEGFTTDGKMIDQKKETTLPVKAMSKKVSERLKEYLIACVMDTPHQKAKPQYVTAGGKTGTAQTGQYDENKNELLHGWFVGFFPAENPQYVVSVISEEATSGNQDASPVFKEIADKLNEPIKLPDYMKSKE